MFGQAIGAVVGSGVGAIGGALQGIGQQSAAKNLRKRIREGVDVGMADTARQVGTVMSSPEYLAATKMLRGLYGMDTSINSIKTDLYDTLTGMYGYNNTFGYGTKNYGKGSDIKMNGNALPANSHAAWNEQYLNQRFGIDNPMETIQGRMMAQAMEIGARGTMQMGEGDIGQGLATRAAELRNYGQHHRILGADVGMRAHMQPGSAMAAPDAGIQAGANAAADFYDQASGMFAPAGSGSQLDTLTADFQKGLAAAQMSRGLYNSRAGAGAEAGALAAFRANKQLEMVPQLLGLAEMPLSMINKYAANNYQSNVFQRTGGKAVYGQETAGAYGGSIAGSIGAGMIQGAGQGAAIGSMYDTASQNESYLDYLKNGKR